MGTRLVAAPRGAGGTGGGGMRLLAAIAPFALNLVQDAQTMLRYDFMRHGFAAGTVVAVMAGVVGYFVVLRQQAFASESLGHVAFAGVLGAALLGLNPLVGLFGGTVAVALGIGALGERVRPRDSEIGTVMAWVLGLGVLFLSLYTAGRAGTPNSTTGLNVLFGSLQDLSAAATQVSVVVGLGVLAAVLVVGRPLLFASLDPDVASARGVPVRALSLIFLVLVGVSVGEATQAVGALLIIALLVTPAATAQRLSLRPVAAMLLAAAVALLDVWLGLTLSFFTALPISFVVTSLAFAGFVLASAWSWWRRRSTGTARASGAIQEPHDATPRRRFQQ